MKLWKNMPKRTAIKQMKNWKFRYLEMASQIKPGDFLSTCCGWNERVKAVHVHWTHYTWENHRPMKGAYVCMFAFETEVGGLHDAPGCCTFPTDTRDEVIAYWRENWADPEVVKECREQGEKLHPIVEALLAGEAGEDIFDEDGQPYFDYLPEHHRKVRFPLGRP